MIKKVICLTLILIILVPTGALCVSEDTKHDEDLKEIFWGKYTSYDDTEELIVLQWAVYFAVDCIAKPNSKASDEIGLAKLRGYGIEGVPQQVSDFHYEGNKFENQYHERYTHLGWDHVYGSGRFDSLGNIAHWPEIRKPLLINAVRQVFIKGKTDLGSTIDIGGWFHQPKTDMSDQQLESMAALIYYVHVLGDHCYNTNSTSIDRIPLAKRTEDNKDPSLIFDLKKHLRVLFRDQQNSSELRSLMKEMDNIHNDVLVLLGDNDYPPSDAQFESYRGYAKKLMNELKKRIPRLLEDSDFFLDVFIEPAA